MQNDDPSHFHDRRKNRHRLNSWKEIAAHLGRAVRTVQRWERDLGLPVHRLEGGKRDIVFAFAEEIDTWMTANSHRIETISLNDFNAANGMNSGEESAGLVTPIETKRELASEATSKCEMLPVTGNVENARVTTRLPWWTIRTIRTPIGVGAALLLMVSATIFLWPVREPTQISISGSDVVALDGAGRELWRHRYPEPLSPESLDELTDTHPSRIRKQFVDLDGDEEKNCYLRPQVDDRATERNLTASPAAES